MGCVRHGPASCSGPACCPRLGIGRHSQHRRDCTCWLSTNTAALGSHAPSEKKLTDRRGDSRSERIAEQAGSPIDWPRNMPQGDSSLGSREGSRRHASCVTISHHFGNPALSSLFSRVAFCMVSLLCSVGSFPAKGKMYEAFDLRPDGTLSKNQSVIATLHVCFPLDPRPLTLDSRPSTPDLRPQTLGPRP